MSTAHHSVLDLALSQRVDPVLVFALRDLPTVAELGGPDFNLGDRVVHPAHVGPVPFGFRGTVVGVDGANIDVGAECC